MEYTCQWHFFNKFGKRTAIINHYDTISQLAKICRYIPGLDLVTVEAI